MGTPTRASASQFSLMTNSKHFHRPGSTPEAGAASSANLSPAADLAARHVADVGRAGGRGAGGGGRAGMPKESGGAGAAGVAGVDQGRGQVAAGGTMKIIVIWAGPEPSLV